MEELLRQTRALRATERGDGEAALPCPDLHAIARIADGSAGANERATLIPHLLACASCRQTVASLGRALSDPSVRVEIDQLDDRGRRAAIGRRTGIGIGALLAASVVLWVTVRPRSEPERFREPATLEAEAPTGVAPVGTVAAAGELRWSSVPQASGYRVTIFTREGATLWEGETRDTAASLPATVVLAPGAAYFWKVEARTGFDRWTSSALTEFTIAPQPGPGR